MKSKKLPKYLSLNMQKYFEVTRLMNLLPTTNTFEIPSDEDIKLASQLAIYFAGHRRRMLEEEVKK